MEQRLHAHIFLDLDLRVSARNKCSKIAPDIGSPAKLKKGCMAGTM
jgi:hypothetical protein